MRSLCLLLQCLTTPTGSWTRLMSRDTSPIAYTDNTAPHRRTTQSRTCATWAEIWGAHSLLIILLKISRKHLRTAFGWNPGTTIWTTMCCPTCNSFWPNSSSKRSMMCGCTWLVNAKKLYISVLRREKGFLIWKIWLGTAEYVSQISI